MPADRADAGRQNMHTFFVNTSKRSLSHYDVLFDVCRETRKLVMLECAMDSWDSGYAACAKKMGDAIESDLELTNEFQLVVYVDLCEVRRSANLTENEDMTVHMKALQRIYLRRIRQTLVQALAEEGRRPTETLVMFGVDRETDAKDEKSQGRIKDLEGKVVEAMMGYFGLPVKEEDIHKIAQPVWDSEDADKPAMLREKIEALKLPDALPGAAAAYEAGISRWYECVAIHKDMKHAFEELLSWLGEKEKENSRICGVDCPYDSSAIDRNKTVRAVVQLSIASYLLECVYSDKMLDEKRQPRPFVLYTADKLTKCLEQRRRMYDAKRKEVKNLSQTFAELKLAPELKKLDHERFGLDQWGERAPQKEEGKALLELEKSFDKPKWEDKKAPTGTEAQPYTESGDALYAHSAEHLARLREFTQENLSNYAAHSDGNHSEQLERRCVDVESSARETATKHWFAGEDSEQEDQDLRPRANTAYDSAVDRYLECCEGRALEIVDIEEQHTWFEARIKQIESSMKYLLVAGIGAVFALVLLYMPFLVLQWEAIMGNALTLAAALVAFGLPFGVLVAVYLALAVRQRQQYRKTWEIFKEKYDEALARNEKARGDYEKLLTTVIPALRWLYEYKIDVEFYAECCKRAWAKTDHHAEKLRQWEERVQNIIEDLNTGKPGDARLKIIELNLNLNLPYCVGEENQKYYSVLDMDAIQTLRRGKKG